MAQFSQGIFNFWACLITGLYSTEVSEVVTYMIYNRVVILQVFKRNDVDCQHTLNKRTSAQWNIMLACPQMHKSKFQKITFREVTWSCQ